jgi:hypothetical protein
VTKVHAHNQGPRCSRKQTQAAPSFSMFCALGTPFKHHNFSLPVRSLANCKHTYMNCTSSPVHGCTARCHHFCKPLELLSTTTMFLRKLFTHKLLCSSSGQYVVLQQGHSVCCARSQSPRTACRNCPHSLLWTCKNIVCIISYVNT